MDKETREQFEKINVQFEKINVQFEKINVQFEKINKKIDERFEKIDERLDNLEDRVNRQGQLLMILVSDMIREQIKKDDLYPFATDEQRIETAVSRILERQNGLSKMVLDYLDKQMD